MGLPSKTHYFFLTDANGRFYYANYDVKGNPVISTQSQPIPLKYSPAELKNSKLTFATNQKYFSLVRAITYPLKFIKDGADILRSCDYLGSGYESIVYLTVIQKDYNTGKFVLAYKGRIDFSRKQDDPRTGYTVSTLDESAWSILAANESVLYQVDCSPTNPKAVRVLFDGVTLNNRAVFQPVSQLVAGDGVTNHNTMVYPLSLISQDGDSAGAILQSQQQTYLTGDSNSLIAYYKAGLNALFMSLYPVTINVQGTISFTTPSAGNMNDGFRYTVMFQTYKNFFTSYAPFVIINSWHLSPNTVYNTPFNKTISLDSSEALYLCIRNITDYSGHQWGTINVANITITTKTKSQPQLCYGLRALDLLQALVSKATRNKYTIQSNYFTENNNDICLSGDAIRQVNNAYIQSSFADWFKSFDAEYHLALRIINGVLWIEPATSVYASGNDIFELGEIRDLILTPAIDYLANEVKVGSPKQDYRHSNGRYEFNSTNSFSLPVTTVQKVIDLTTKYRTDSYGISFLILDYQGESSKDNLGDTDVFMVKLSNTKGTATTPVETFVSLTMDNAPTAPYIQYPQTGTCITNDKPTIRGMATPSTLINIYADHTLDGSTTSDSTGAWSYTIATALQSYAYTTNPDGTINVIHTGQHVIDATFTDDAGIVNTTNITVDTTRTTATTLITPDGSVSLYNNKPFLKGVAQTSTTVTITIDGTVAGTTTADGSCLWFFQCGLLLDGLHNIDINGIVTAITVIPRSSITYPLITSFLDGFTETNNLPTITGVAMPNVTVQLWLNYIPETMLGQTVSDGHGNWSFTVLPQLLPINPPIPYIPNGSNIISTGLVNNVVLLDITGYLPNKPLYSEIDGVIDNTIFNTEYSPKRMLLNRGAFWKSIFYQLQNKQIVFEASDKNALLKTVLNGVTVQENTSINISDLPDNPLFLPIKAKFKTQVNSTFNEIFYNFSSGGYLHGTYKGNDLFLMPIGQMTQANITDEVQEWELLLSPLNTLNNISKLSKSGLTVQLMQNAISHSDYNELHFVQYNYTKDAKYNTFDMYQEWFKNRNPLYVSQPDYYQKIQTCDITVDQIVSNNLANLNLKIYNNATGVLVDTIVYTSVSSQPTISPDITQEAAITWNSYGAGTYFVVMCIDATPLLISEKVIVQDIWSNTILIESSSSVNKDNIFYSTGFVSKMRIEGLVTNWTPEIVTYQNKDEIGNNQMLHSIPSRKKSIYFGDVMGLPDWAAIKVGLLIQNDTLLIEGQQYVMLADSKMERNDNEGYPMYYYKIDFEPASNQHGLVAGGVNANLNSVVLVVDASAFGGASDTVIDITINEN